jgi:hypothetical protein
MQHTNLPAVQRLAFLLYFCIMDLNYLSLLPPDFAPASRVWIYQGNRLFSDTECRDIEVLLTRFATNWQSHGAPVKGFGGLFFRQFIILMADETASGVSGCSTDSSVRLIKEIERLFGVELFNRQLLAFFINHSIQLLPFPQVQQALDSELIHSNTLYFNNLVATKEALMNEWIVPLKDSWLGTKMAIA